MTDRRLRTGKRPINHILRPSAQFLIKRASISVEIRFEWFFYRCRKMTIYKIARTVFDSFQNSDIILTILDRTGSYVSNKVEVFEQVFSSQELLDNLCGRIDDGCEPLISQIGDYAVAAMGLSANGSFGGYVVMLLPGCNLEKAIGCTDFIEIILSQVTLLAERAVQDSQIPGLDYQAQLQTESVLN